MRGSQLIGLSVITRKPGELARWVSVAVMATDYGQFSSCRKPRQIAAPALLAGLLAQLLARSGDLTDLALAFPARHVRFMQGHEALGPFHHFGL